MHNIFSAKKSGFTSAVFLLLGVNVILGTFIIFSIINPRYSKEFTSSVFNTPNTVDYTVVEVQNNLMALIINNERQTIDLNSVRIDEFSETELENWVNQNFKSINLRPKLSPEIEVEKQQVKNCSEGIEGTYLPTQELYEKLNSSETPIEITIKTKPITFSDEDNKINKICKDYKKLLNAFLSYEDKQFLTEKEISEIFSIELVGDRLKVKIRNSSILVARLNDIKKLVDEKDFSVSTKYVNGKAVVITPYKSGKKLNVPQSFIKIQNSLTKDEIFEKLPLHFSNKNFNETFGQDSLYYPIFLGAGTARFSMNQRGWISRVSVRQTIMKGLDKINGYVIEPNEQFSLIKALDANTGGNIGDEKYTVGICGVSTVTFRAALESGLPIVERHGHKQGLYNYNYPYGGLVDAALYLAPGSVQDMKFVNDSGQRIIILTDYWTEGDLFNYRVRFYGDQFFAKREVKLSNFKREPHKKGNSFKEEFARTVNGYSEVFATQYYMSDFSSQ